MLVKQTFNLEVLIRELENNKDGFSFIDCEKKAVSWKLENVVYNFKLHSPHIMEVHYFLNDDTEDMIKEIHKLMSSKDFIESLYKVLSEYSNSLRSYKKRVKKLKIDI